MNMLRAITHSNSIYLLVHAFDDPLAVVGVGLNFVLLHKCDFDLASDLALACILYITSRREAIYMP